VKATGSCKPIYITIVLPHWRDLFKTRAVPKKVWIAGLGAKSHLSAFPPSFRPAVTRSTEREQNTTTMNLFCSRTTSPIARNSRNRSKRPSSAFSRRSQSLLEKTVATGRQQDSCEFVGTAAAQKAMTRLRSGWCPSAGTSLAPYQSRSGWQLHTPYTCIELGQCHRSPSISLQSPGPRTTHSTLRRRYLPRPAAHRSEC
jgi:hypothetical protein